MNTRFFYYCLATVFLLCSCTMEQQQVSEDSKLIRKTGTVEKNFPDFDKNLPFINKLEFQIVGLPNWNCTTRTCTIEENRVRMEGKYYYYLSPGEKRLPGSIIVKKEDDEMLMSIPHEWVCSKEAFLAKLRELSIEKWKLEFFPEYIIMDGASWGLRIYFSNGCKPVEISGTNAYPENFKSLQELLKTDD